MIADKHVYDWDALNDAAYDILQAYKKAPRSVNYRGHDDTRSKLVTHKKSNTSPQFYVYTLCFPDGKPFYVGKGQGTRIYDHEYQARTKCLCKKCETIRKVWRSGKQIQRYIVFTTYDEQEAMRYEADTINLYGLANLINQSPGTRNLNRTQPTTAVPGTRLSRAEFDRQLQEYRERKRLERDSKVKNT